MPAPDTFELLRRTDPARELQPTSADARERLRQAIVAEPGPVAPRRKPGRRARLVLVATALALIVCAGAWGVYNTLDSPETVRGQFEDATKTIPLPPGAAWADPGLDENGWYGQRAGLMHALYQAECAWLRYWDEGDAAQKGEAVAGFRRIRALMPLHPEGASEDVGGYDAGTLRFFDQMIAEAARGDGTTVRQYLRANC
jgi:hypothetical protein